MLECSMQSSFSDEQNDMVRTQLSRRGIHNEGVLRAMATVPRHLFVPNDVQAHAYEDRALPLSDGQTISQPFIVALMIQILDLRGSERVLDIGTGSGYAAAVLSTLSTEVYSVERSETLAKTAQERLTWLGYTNVQVVVGDGTTGLYEHAPYDAIHVAAASPWVPRPLRQQLAEGGRLVIPVGGNKEQMLLQLVKRQGTTHVKQLGGVRFVPLVGEHAWGG
jgi:protein-L-isoaspartate(D-aspartate) O-methyltransferase